MCYSPEDMDGGKRPRIAAELLSGGFKEPFNYQTLEIPFAQVSTIIDEDGERFPESSSPPDEDIEMRDGALPKARQKAITPVSRGQWPAQFDPQHFQKRGFLHAIKEPRFKDLKYKYQLVAACRENNITGFTYWRKRSVLVFKRWMENVMAGRRAENNGVSGERKKTAERKKLQRRKTTVEEYGKEKRRSKKPVCKASTFKRSQRL